jgi:hypothetical protein
MITKSRVRELVILAIILVLGLSSPVLAVQKKGKKKDGQKKEMPKGTPVLWQEPSDIATRDLFLGPGGEEMKPDLRSVTFIKKEEGGFSTKYRVRDASGREWVAKVSNEAQPETAAVRLVWAVGYYTEINYLAPCVQIIGAPKADKFAGSCTGGAYENVRFEARSKEIKRLDEWMWTKNPFVGTKELQGLIVLMALMNNWDLKDLNNKILHVRDSGTGRDELRYIISDLGATFGKTGGNAPLVWRITRSRNKPEDFVKETFIEEVKNNNVFFKYNGKMQELFDDISVEEARWIGALLGRLSDEQLSDAFRAANYTPEEIQMLTGAVRSRINELVNLPGQAGGAVGGQSR